MHEVIKEAEFLGTLLNQMEKLSVSKTPADAFKIRIEIDKMIMSRFSALIHDCTDRRGSNPALVADAIEAYRKAQYGC